MAKKRKTNLKKQADKRFLNIIYFVDSEATKSIKLSVRTFRLLVVLFFGIIAWTAASSFIIFQSYSKNQALETELRTSLTTIFDFQTRYEGVYEEAYPNRVSEVQEQETETQIETSEVKKASVVVKPTKQQEKVAEVMHNKEKPAAAKEKKEASKPIASKKVEFAKPTKDKAIESAEEASQQVAIENPLFKKQSESSFQLQFDLRNTQSPKKAEGYVWAVAQVDLEDGTTIRLSTPNNVALNTNDAPDSKSGLKRFSIRYYKRKKLNFKNIKGKVKKVHSFMIGVLKSDGGFLKYTVDGTIPWAKEDYKNAGIKETKDGLVLKVQDVVSQKM